MFQMKYPTTSWWNFAKTSQCYVSTTSYWNVVTTSQKDVTRHPISTSPRRLKQVSNETPNVSVVRQQDVSMAHIRNVILVRPLQRSLLVPNETPGNIAVVRLHHVLKIRCHDALLVGLYYIFKWLCHDLHLVGFHASLSIKSNSNFF